MKTSTIIWIGAAVVVVGVGGYVLYQYFKKPGLAEKMSVANLQVVRPDPNTPDADLEIAFNVTTQKV